jgi:myo-inositol 2-dehydrogenase / D-chiro-inositol 1-dehydrogenase
MRIGLLGAGRIGRMHAAVLTGIDEVDELLIGDPDTEAATAVASELGARALPPEAVIDEADALVIAAASDAHLPLVRAGLERAVPIFCEKPLTKDLVDAIAVAAEIEQAGTPFQLGFQRRFDEGYLEAKRVVDSGELGTLYSVRMAGHDPAPPHESYVPVSGGLFRDFSGHDFDILRWLTSDEVEEIYADGSVREFPMFAKYDDHDNAVACLRMRSGALVVMTVSRHDPRGYDIRTELFGSKDSISVGLGPHQVIRSVEPGVPEPVGPAWPNFQVRFAQAYRDEMLGFFALARGETKSACTARDGVESARIAEAATLALHEHRIVRLEEIPA